MLLYELLPGETPFDIAKFPNDSYLTLLQRIREEDVEGVRLGRRERSTQRRAALEGDLDAITLKALDRNRSRCYASPALLAEDIQRHLRNAPIAARPASKIYRAGKYVRRHRLGVSFAVILALLLIAGAIGQSFQLQRTKRERDRADRIVDFMSGMFEVSDPGTSRGNDIRAQKVLEKAARDINTGLTEDPELKAQMMALMGTVYSTSAFTQKPIRCCGTPSIPSACC